jgi:hypothetical protein
MAVAESSQPRSRSCGGGEFSPANLRGRRPCRFKSCGARSSGNSAQPLTVKASTGLYRLLPKIKPNSLRPSTCCAPAARTADSRAGSRCLFAVTRPVSVRRRSVQQAKAGAPPPMLEPLNLPRNRPSRAVGSAPTKEFCAVWQAIQTGGPAEPRSWPEPSSAGGGRAKCARNLEPQHPSSKPREAYRTVNRCGGTLNAVPANNPVRSQ